MRGHAQIYCASRNFRFPGQSGRIGELARKQAGATLMEVLVTFVILSIGILGLAGLQTRALVYSQSALYRSHATALVDDITDRMRANRGADYTGVGAGLAATDLTQWRAQITNLLPGGTGTVAVSSGVYTITITWNDVRSATTNTTESSSTVKDIQQNTTLASPNTTLVTRVRI